MNKHPIYCFIEPVASTLLQCEVVVAIDGTDGEMLSHRHALSDDGAKFAIGYTDKRNQAPYLLKYPEDDFELIWIDNISAWPNREELLAKKNAFHGYDAVKRGTVLHTLIEASRIVRDY